jgi:hypothetical protein
MVRILLILCFVSGFCLTGIAQSQKENAEYEVVRQAANITLYERWRDFPGTTTKARDLKIVFYAAATPEKMLSMVTEEANLKTWQKNLEEYKIHPGSDTAWHVYSYYKMPWPLTDQDYYARYRVVSKSAFKIVIEFKPAENLKTAPLREKIDRMPAYGKWVIEKTSTGKSKVTYTITGKPVNIPRGVTDNLVRNNFMNTITELIAVAEK